jgi:hypothetical protein
MMETMTLCPDCKVEEPEAAIREPEWRSDDPYAAAGSCEVCGELLVWEHGKWVLLLAGGEGGAK